MNISVILLADERTEVYHITEFYKNLERFFKKFQLFLTYQRPNEKLVDALQTCSKSLENCNFISSVNLKIDEGIENIIPLCDYNDVIITRLCLSSEDIAYIEPIYSNFSKRSCCMLYESNNSKLKTCFGVVLPRKNLELILRKTEVKSPCELFIQLAFLYCFIGDSYRVNFSGTFFTVYPKTLRQNGVGNRLRLRYFRRRCYKFYKADFDSKAEYLDSNRNYPYD